MHMPQSRGVRVTGTVTFSPARYFLVVSGSMFAIEVCPSGAASLPYHTLLMPLIFEGRPSLALKKASQSCWVASLMEVHAKQCISFFSPAEAEAQSSRSEEHTSELQSRGLISYAVFCLKK